MIQTLRSRLFLLACIPLALFAQVNAGDPDGVFYTTMGEGLHPLPLTYPSASEDTASVDLEGDGVFDLKFSSGTSFYVDDVRLYNKVKIEHAGVEVAMDAPDGYVAKRLDEGAVIDANLPWRAFDTLSTNLIDMCSRGSTIGGPYTYGGNEWLVNGAVATPGYLGVRVVVDGGTRYGWIGLVSYVSQDSAWLMINNMGIEDVSSRVEEMPSLDRITARIMPDGKLILQGPLSDVQRITLQDAIGRIVRQVAGPAPNTIDLSGEAHGVYMLGLIGRTGRRSLKLAW